MVKTMQPKHLITTFQKSGLNHIRVFVWKTKQSKVKKIFKEGNTMLFQGYAFIML